MKTKLFYLVAIFAIAMVSFSSCGGDKDEVATPDEPTVKPIISQTVLEGSWNFQSVAVNGKTYYECGTLSNDGLSDINMSFKFDFDYSPNYNGCGWTNNCSGEVTLVGIQFTYNTAKNLIEIENGLKFQVQSYNSATKTLIFKVTATSGQGGWELLANAVYTLKKV
jgi:hypothetical protein